MNILSAAGILLSVLGLISLIFTVVFIKDVIDNKDKLERDTNIWITAILGFVVNFFDTLGIGSFAPTTALLRVTKQTKDRLIPGTLNVSCMLPIAAESFFFISSVNVEPITLVSMIVAAVAGAYLGAGIVVKLPTKKIRIAMAIALLMTGIIMTCRAIGVFPTGGVTTGLSGIKLVIGVGVNFILGALMTIGIGLYAPCMALVYLLGMSPEVAFPIMMGSCAYLMPIASIKFIKESAYNRMVSIIVSISGIVGVWVAYTFVRSLELKVLTWVVIAVMVYTSVSLFIAARKK